jgi:hypothetical protein
MSKIIRNNLCPCGSGIKSKKCCGTGTVGYLNNPALAVQYNEQGNALEDQGRLAEAVLCYDSDSPAMKAMPVRSPNLPAQIIRYCP